MKNMNDSFIFFNTNKLGNITDIYNEKYGDKLNFNSDTAWCFTDRKFLLISSHLSSKKEKFVHQAEEMIETLTEIKR